MVLGGVKIPFPKGLYGHSDGDVLTHALCDALLGASGLGDLGTLFPPSDPSYEGVLSLQFLEEVVKRVRDAGWRVVNVDAVIIAQQPTLSPYLGEMKATLAPLLGISPETLSLKPKSPEGVGALGASGGIAALAVALLEGI